MTDTPHFPPLHEDLAAWARSHDANFLHAAVRARLSLKWNEARQQYELGTYVTPEDLSAMVSFLMVKGRSGNLTWDEYLAAERALFNQINLRMQIATGMVQRHEAEDGSEKLTATMPVDRVDAPDGVYLLKGPLAATITDDGLRIEYHLRSFEGTFPITNATFTIRRKTGEIDIRTHVDKHPEIDWRAARQLAFEQFERLYAAADPGVRDAVAQVLPA